MNIFYQCVKSSVGDLYIVARSEKLIAVIFECNWESYYKKLQKRAIRESSLVFCQATALLERVKTQLSEYFNGTRQQFDLPFELDGTDFQQRVWLALADIPYGETRSYGQQAHHIGVPKAARAIGRADGQNPVSIVLPCHRVVGSTGKLTGYGGGLEAKRLLLELEGGGGRVLKT